jgi:acetylornithine aminotransferase
LTCYFTKQTELLVMTFVRVAARRLPLAKRLVSAVESPLQRRYASAVAGAQVS